MEDLIASGLELKRPEGIEEAYRLIKTALWCIQGNSALRPSMETVVRILEGALEVMDPPLDCTFPFGPSIVYVKPTGDITLSIAEETDTDMASADYIQDDSGKEVFELGNGIP